MIWIVLLIISFFAAFSVFAYGIVKDEPIYIIPMLVLVSLGGLCLDRNYQYGLEAKKIAPFSSSVLVVQETDNGMQFVEYKDEVININDYFGKSFEVGQEIYVNKYEKNSYGGANSAPYWKLVENLDPESKNAN